MGLHKLRGQRDNLFSKEYAEQFESTTQIRLDIRKQISNRVDMKYVIEAQRCGFY